MNTIPRRAYINKMTPEELDIYNLVQKVERLGAHPLLTEVVVLLGSAREKLADWVDLPVELPDGAKKLSCLCPDDGVYPLCSAHKTKSSPR